MNQSKLESGIEVALNTAIGYGIAFILWPLVAHIVGYPYETVDNLIITTIFTAVSLIRGYIIRRWFNNKLHKAALKIAAAVKEKT